MKLTGVSLSLLVAFGPAASRCDSAGETSAAAVSDNVQGADTTAESPPPVPNSPPPDDPGGAPGTQPPDTPVAFSRATQSPQPLDNPPGVATAADPPAPTPGLLREVQPILPGTEEMGQGEPEGEPAPGDSVAVAAGDDASGYDDTDPAAVTDFRGALDPYGTWTDDSPVGTVWVPSPDEVGPDFRPYVTAGHWTYVTSWIWASDYVWGWAPFHYGRWIFLRGRGWAWVPGRAYRGAWVSWSVDSAYSYVGWSPMPPLFIWVRGVAVTWEGPQQTPRWSICPRTSIFAPALAARVLVGAAAAPLVTRMHPLGTPSGTLAGPSPERLGYASSQVPRPVGTAAVTVARAVQFSRPSTAVALGARPPSHGPLPMSSAGGWGNAPAAPGYVGGGFARGAVPPESGRGVGRRH